MEIVADGVVDEALLRLGLAPRLVAEDDIVVPPPLEGKRGVCRGSRGRRGAPALSTARGRLAAKQTQPVAHMPQPAGRLGPDRACAGGSCAAAGEKNAHARTLALRLQRCPAPPRALRAGRSGAAPCAASFSCNSGLPRTSSACCSASALAASSAALRAASSARSALMRSSSASSSASSSSCRGHKGPVPGRAITGRQLERHGTAARAHPGLPCCRVRPGRPPWLGRSPAPLLPGTAKAAEVRTGRTAQTPNNGAEGAFARRAASRRLRHCRHCRLHRRLHRPHLLPWGPACVACRPPRRRLAPPPTPIVAGPRLAPLQQDREAGQQHSGAQSCSLSEHAATAGASEANSYTCAHRTACWLQVPACVRTAMAPTLKIMAFCLQVVLALLLLQLGPHVACCKLIHGVLTRLPAAGQEERGADRQATARSGGGGKYCKPALAVHPLLAPEFKFGVPRQVLHGLLLDGRVNAHTALLLMALQVRNVFEMTVR